MKVIYENEFMRIVWRDAVSGCVIEKVDVLIMECMKLLGIKNTECIENAREMSLSQTRLFDETEFTKQVVRQVQYIEAKGWMPLLLRPSDYVVITQNDCEYYVFTSVDKLLKINNNNCLRINQVYEKIDCFCSPELVANDVLPCTVPAKSAYWSIGMLIALVAFGLDGSSREEMKKIENTPHYYFLQRAMMNDPDERELVWLS